MTYRMLIVTGMLGLASLNTASAQELRGSVRGVITDSSGSFVGGAQVSLKNISTNIQVQRESNEVGQLTETIRVTDAPVTVQFNKTTRETTLDTKMSNSLPIIHRNPFLLLT